ncbi:DUF2917 domain-containing protein [Sulfurirhabdus autotrophica]|uniref:DUF2917 family protein n=1 Tax=Sulfurirhabdus autotrophica TaxID=1706046 RepID=A0A4R3Y4X9_9PROT|nr:DUF2917 domain-containing protein [Sulfurirhabdus autotrophica]TCV85858.1 DUF2917 family protein [Sulfurirhabdus autotrophica]
MLLSLRNMEIQLAEGKPLAFRGARNVYLECTEGMVWITAEGQPGDFLLVQGERLRIENNGLVLVQGLPSGAIRLISEAPWSILLANRFNRCFHLLAILPRLVQVKCHSNRPSKC